MSMQDTDTSPKTTAHAMSPAFPLPRTLLFLDSTNESSGRVVSPTARRLIRSHVMREYRKQQTGLNDQPEKTSSSQLSKQRSPKSSKQDLATLSSSENSPAARTENSASNFSEDTSSECQTIDWQPEYPADPQHHLNAVTDGFVYAGTSSIDFRSYGLFNHYASEFRLLYCRHTLPANLSGLSSDLNICCTTVVEQNSAALLHAVCFHASSHQGLARAVIQGPRHTVEYMTQESNAQRDTLRHKSESLRQLNKMLRQGRSAITEGSILCVTILRATEAVLGDVEAVKAHTTGMIQLIEAFGGIDCLAPVIAVQVYIADIKAAILVDAQPSFPMNQNTRCRFDIFSGTPSQPHDTNPSAFGSRFFSELISGQICLELQQCLRYERHLALVVEAWMASSDSVPTISIEEYLVLEHRLLSLPFERALTSLEDCIRIALLLYTSIGLWDTPLYVAWVECLVTRLQMAVERLKARSTSLLYPELMLWMLFLGRYAVGAHMNVERAWFNENLLETIETLNITRWQEANEILSGFFYVDRVFHTRFFRIWCAMKMGSDEMEDLDLYRHTCKSGRAFLSLRKFLGYKPDQ